MENRKCSTMYENEKMANQNFGVQLKSFPERNSRESLRYKRRKLTNNNLTFHHRYSGRFRKLQP
jgi:hypothetical protein